MFWEKKREEKRREEVRKEEKKKKKMRNKGMDLWIFAWVLVLYGLLRVCMRIGLFQT